MPVGDNVSFSCCLQQGNNKDNMSPIQGAPCLLPPKNPKCGKLYVHGWVMKIRFEYTAKQIYSHIGENVTKFDHFQIDFFFFDIYIAQINK